MKNKFRLIIIFLSLFCITFAQINDTHINIYDSLLNISNIKQKYDDKIVVATYDFGGFEMNDSCQCDDNRKYIDIYTGSKWKCKVITFDKADAQFTANNPHLIGVILNNGKNKIVTLCKSAIDYPNLQPRFILEKEFIKQVNNEKKESKVIIKDLVKKYGKEYGLLISIGKVKVGMSKKMCEAAWGVTFDIRKISKSSKVIETWIYPSGGSLIFTNGILTKILE